MKLQLERNTQGRPNAIYFRAGVRDAWIGKAGLGFGGAHYGYNAHWHDLRHPWERYLRGEFRFAMFWKQLWRGLSAFFGDEGQRV